MVQTNTMKNGNRARAERLTPKGTSLRKSSRLSIPIAFDSESNEPTSRAKEMFSPLKVERVVVPFDFSEASVRVLKWVNRGTEDAETQIVILHVVYPWISPTRYEPYYFDPNQERINVARSLLRHALKKTSGRLDVRNVHVVIGVPSDQIVSFAQSKEVDLIVMAARRKRGLKRLFPATIERVVRRASCPVLVLPEGKLPDEGRGSNDLRTLSANYNLDNAPQIVPGRCSVWGREL